MNIWGEKNNLVSEVYKLHNVDLRWLLILSIMTMSSVLSCRIPGDSMDRLPPHFLISYASSGCFMLWLVLASMKSGHPVANTNSVRSTWLYSRTRQNGHLVPGQRRENERSERETRFLDFLIHCDSREPYKISDRSRVPQSQAQGGERDLTR